MLINKTTPRHTLDKTNKMLGTLASRLRVIARHVTNNNNTFSFQQAELLERFINK